MNKNLKATIILLGLVVALIYVAPYTPLLDIGKPAAASPTIYQYSSSPTNYAFSSLGVKTASIPQNSYDKSNATNTEWGYTRSTSYGGSDGYYELNTYGPTAGPPRGSPITQVDLSLSYYVQSAASTTPWIAPINALSANNAYTYTVVTSATYKWTDYGFSTGGWTGVTKVEVGLERKIATGGDDRIIIRVSGDNGTTWSATTYTDTPPTTEALAYIDVTSAFSWTPTMVSKIAVCITSEQVGGAFSRIDVDWLPVRATPTGQGAITNSPTKYASMTDATLKLSYLVNPSGTEGTLVLWTPANLTTSGWRNATYTNKAEPNGGGWSWEDVTNLKFRFTRNDPQPFVDAGGIIRIYEVWAVVHYDYSQQVHINPRSQYPIPTTVKINVTGIEELYGFEFKLTYNTTAVTATGLTLGPYLNTTVGTANTYGYKVKLDDAAGIVWATQSIKGDLRGGSVAIGAWATLANVTFTATDPNGPTNLNLEMKLAGLNYVLKKTYPISFTLVQPVHNVEVTSVIAAPTSVTRGDSVTIDVNIKNKGDYREYFYVTDYANTSTSKTAIETKNSGYVGIGATAPLSFTWSTRDFQASNYTTSATAAVHPGVTDADLIDNTKYGTKVEVNPLFGDINADGWVDDSDLFSLNVAYGSQPGDRNYSLDADLNKDSLIDAKDLRLLGKAWQPPP